MIKLMIKIAVIVLVLMVALVIFARLATIAPTHLLLPVLVMLWSFLALVVATAFLLFTCAFFQWPKAVRELIGARGPVESDTSAQVSKLLTGARVQLEARDYPGAWRGVDEAVRLAPDSKPAQELQVLVAMAWLRDTHLVAPATFSEIVDRVSPCLYQTAPGAKGALAADIYAHLGWGNFLKSREGVENLKIEEHYKKAVELDPANPYAQVMWGHWLVTQHRQLAEAKAHFQKAFESGREKEFVRDYQLAALQWDESVESTDELLRVINEMRKSNERLPLKDRNELFSRIYESFASANEQSMENILSVLPPAEHLAAYLWLTDGMDMNQSADRGFFLARLTEAAGDCPKAMALYRQLLAQDTSHKDQIQAGLVRCKKHTGDDRSEAQALLDQARSGDTSTRVNIIESLTRAGINPADVLPALIAWAKDENSEVRAAACETLVQFGGPAVAQVATLLSSPQTRDVLNGVNILGRIGKEPKVAVPALIPVLKQANTKVAGEAIDALATFGPDAAPAVPALLDLAAQAATPDLKQKIAFALGEIGPAAKEAVPQLMDLLKSDKDQEASLSQVAAASLGKIGPPAAAAVPLLIVALKSGNVQLPRIAAEALGNIGANAKSAVPAVLDAMKTEDKEDWIIYAIALGKIASALMDAGDKESLPSLTKVLSTLELANMQQRFISPVREAVTALKQKP